MSKRNYDKSLLATAIGSVKTRKLNPSQASREYGIPRQTIVDGVNGIYAKRTPGPAKMLLQEEETALVEYIKYMGQRGFPLSRQHLRCYVMEIIKRSDRETLFNTRKGPSDKWIRKFLAKNNELKEKIPQNRDKGRTRMSNQTVMDNFFQKYEQTLNRLNLRNKPEQIYNCDETGFVDKQGNSKKVIGEKGRPCIQQQVHTIDHVTAHMCVSGDGRVLPSFLIFQKSLPHRPYREDVPRSWMFGVSDSGYMDTDLFQIWFKGIFLKYCSKERPVLLLLDNHDSHISIPLIEMAKAEQVEILAFPAHTTHLLQPLDVNIIGPIKGKMKSLATSMAIINSNLCISKANLPALLSYSIDQTCSAAFVKSAFRKSGPIPFNKDAIDRSHLLPEDFQKCPSSSNSSTESSKEQTDDNTNTRRTCVTCGASTSPHPLQAVRDLPPVLQSIFITPALPSKVVKKRRVVTEARVITADAMLDQLKKKEEEEKEKREGIEKRKRERDQKRKERENLKAEKEGKKKSKSGCEIVDHDSEEEEYEDESVVCAMCERRDPGQCDDEAVTSWIMCELCDRWFHEICVQVVSEDFVCDECS